MLLSKHGESNEKNMENQMESGFILWFIRSRLAKFKGPLFESSCIEGHNILGGPYWGPRFIALNPKP